MATKAVYSEEVKEDYIVRFLRVAGCTEASTKTNRYKSQRLYKYSVDKSSNQNIYRRSLNSWDSVLSSVISIEKWL